MSLTLTKDRPWNDPGPRKGAPPIINSNPTLKAVILDFSSVNNVDITSVQNLIDIRNQLDSYAAPDVVEWHFASINNRWTKRALAAAGFGLRTEDSRRAVGAEPTDRAAPAPWKAIFSVAEIGGRNPVAVESARKAEVEREHGSTDLEVAKGAHVGSLGDSVRVAPTHGVNLPLFHVDLVAAVQAALVEIHGEAVPV
jgi:solute carrier family 26 (sodium-independent sulfate anion transporter), member 11